jgi:hypothetical protein
MISHCFIFFSCWLSIETGLLWAFVGPALLVIFVSIICYDIPKLVFFKIQTNLHLFFFTSIELPLV